MTGTKMKLAFIGGCLNNQIGLAKSSSYHYILRQFLDTALPEYSINLSLGYYTSYNLLAKSAISLIEKKSADILFLFLRPFPLMALNKLWIKFNTEAEKSARILHPSVFNRKNMHWPPNLTNYPLENAVIEPRREKFGLRDLNLLSGLSIGLNKWAVKYVANEVETINNFCKAQNKKLILLSLPQNPESLVGNYICQLTNKKLKSRLQHIPFIEIFFMGEDCFEPDGIHYNPKGHRLLAEVLHTYLSKNIVPIPQTAPSILQTQ